MGLIQYIPDSCVKFYILYPIKSWYWPEAILPIFVFILFWITATQLNIQKEENEFYITLLAWRSCNKNETQNLLFEV